MRLFLLFKAIIRETPKRVDAYNITCAAHGECSTKMMNKKMSEADPPPDASQLERLAAFLRLIPEGGPLDRLLKGAALLENPPSTPAELASDILHGADQIAHFLYGREKHRRKVYRLVAAGKLPHFRLGNNICSRKSVLTTWIDGNERRSIAAEIKSLFS